MKKFGHGSRSHRSAFSQSYLKQCTDQFGYMSPTVGRKKNNKLPFTLPNLNKLDELGEAIGTKVNQTESQIPAGYTYLGQFIDHDITFDPFSKLDEKQNPEKIPNLRIPCLDLDSVYGRGPKVDPHLYQQNSDDTQFDGIKLLIGSNQGNSTGGPPDSSGTEVVPSNFDVPRTSNNTAILGDPRNDENLIVSQLHHAFLKFHNQIVDDLVVDVQPEKLFEEARKTVIHYYQWIVLNDFLKRIAIPNIVDETKVCQMFFTRKSFKMPIEFSVAAYRFGHSMIRSTYNLNSNFENESLAQVFAFINKPHIPVRSNWVIDFNRFFDTGSQSFDFNTDGNRAIKIDTALSPELNSLPGPLLPILQSLPKRNLRRGLALQLPFAQALTDWMGIDNLTRTELLQDASQEEIDVLLADAEEFISKTPLWYYILKEAEVQQDGERLGELGSTIVSEVFIRILTDDPDSILNNDFTPTIPRIDSSTGDFTIADLLNHAGVLSQ